MLECFVVPSTAVPASVRRLFWDVPPKSVDLVTHRDYVMERVMVRGSWEAMRWLRRTYPNEALADFLRRKGDRLPARDRAYWSLVSGVRLAARAGGGRPSWAG
jgi:hypothetical protein